MIEGDAGFLRPGSGVRGGSGTVDDPYVISDWSLVHTGADAVRLVGTRAHVVLEDLHIEGFPDSRAGFALDCRVGGRPCDGTAGLALVGAENVTLRDSRILVETYGVRAVGSSRVIVEDVRFADYHHLEDRAKRTVGSMTWAVSIEDGAQTTIRRIEAPGAQVVLVRVREATVEDSTFSGPSPSVAVYARDVERLAVESSTFVRRGFTLGGTNEDVRVVENRFVGANGDFGFDTTFPSATAGLLLCANTFEDPGTFAMFVDTGYESFGAGLRHADVRIVGNEVSGETVALHLYASDGARVERNIFRDVREVSSWNSETLWRHNSFGGVANGVSLGGPGANARWNWWGDPSGPSFDGPGVGTPLMNDPYEPVPFEPWLETPPAAGPTALDCDAA